MFNATQNTRTKFSHLSCSCVTLGNSLWTSFLCVKMKILQCQMGFPSTFHLQRPSLSLLWDLCVLPVPGALSSVVKP